MGYMGVRILEGKADAIRDLCHRDVDALPLCPRDSILWGLGLATLPGTCTAVLLALCRHHTLDISYILRAPTVLVVVSVLNIPRM